MIIMTPQEAATQLVNTLAKDLGLQPTNVRLVRLTPTTIEIETYETNDDGNKFIDSQGKVATATRTLEYRYA